MYIRGERGVGIKQGGGVWCSGELGDRFGAKNMEAQVE